MSHGGSGNGGGRKIIVVKKKKGGHAGHHGGVVEGGVRRLRHGHDGVLPRHVDREHGQGVKEMVQGYFRNPVGFKKTFSGGTNPMAAGNFITNLEVKRTVILNRRLQEKRFEEAAVELHGHARGRLGAGRAERRGGDRRHRRRPAHRAHGDRGRGTFFEPASASLRPALKSVLGHRAARCWSTCPAGSWWRGTPTRCRTAGPATPTGSSRWTGPTRPGGSWRPAAWTAPASARCGAMRTAG